MGYKHLLREALGEEADPDEVEEQQVEEHLGNGTANGDTPPVSDHSIGTLMALLIVFPYRLKCIQTLIQ